MVRSYAPQYFDELELKEGDVVAFLEELEEGWWRGMKLGNASPVRLCKDVVVLVWSYSNNTKNQEYDEFYL